MELKKQQSVPSRTNPQDHTLSRASDDLRESGPNYDTFSHKAPEINDKDEVMSSYSHES